MTFSYLYGAVVEPTHYAFNGYKPRYWDKHSFASLILAILFLLLVTATGGTIYQLTQRKGPEAFVFTPVGYVEQQANQVNQDPDIELQAAIGAWAREQQGEWAIGVYPTTPDGLYAFWRAETQFELGDLQQLFYVLPLAQRTPVDQWSKAKIGDKTYEQCFYDMLHSSEKVCTDGLMQKVGKYSAHVYATNNGFKDTILNKRDAPTATMADAGYWLARLVTENGINGKLHTLTKQALARDQRDFGKRLDCKTCTFMSKESATTTGRQVGMIIKKDGKSQVVMVMTKGGTEQQVDDILKKITSRL